MRFPTLQTISATLADSRICGLMVWTVAAKLLLQQNMHLKLIAGNANVPLAENIAHALDVPLSNRDIYRFPDGELHVEIQETVRGDDVYLIQPTGPPVEERLFELLLLADACRRAGAASVTAVVSYFGYARHDRRASGREAVGARLVADLIGAARVNRVVALDLHVTSLEGFFPVPVEHLTAVPRLLEQVRCRVTDNSIVVAADLGAAKLAERYASALGVPAAIVHKRRLSGEQVRVRAIAGEVRGRVPLIIDDMISTGGTVEAAVKALVEAGAVPEVDVVATHGVLVGAAIERLAGCGVRGLIVTDSVMIPDTQALPLEVVSVGSLLADAIGRLHRGQSLAALIRHE